jgi:DNA-binding transcriptional ArsR family regulator
VGISKTELFTLEQNELSALAKAIAHPARIAILQHLARINACVCGDIVDEVGLAQPTVSQHLKELKAVGLIQGTVEGTSICYCINPDVWKRCRSLFGAFFATERLKDSCC